MKDTPSVAQHAPAPPLSQPAHVNATPQPAAPQVQYVTYEVHGPTAQRQDEGLGMTVRTMGIVALSFMAIGFIPCLGWFNYLNIVLSFITIIIGIVAIAGAKSDAERSPAVIGVALVVIAIFLGTGRLILGGGCL
jgi:hypothetical protein